MGAGGEYQRSHLAEQGLVAIEEYEQKKERLGFLEGQLADVEKARTDLTATIDKINYTARRLFKETFEDVRRNYVAVFHTLFEGGRADLFMEVAKLRAARALWSRVVTASGGSPVR